MYNLTELKDQLTIIEAGTISKKNVLTFKEACIFTGISRSYMYKLTSGQKVPHFKPFGGMVYFNRVDLESWLLKNQIKTNINIEVPVSTDRKVAK